MGIIVAILFVGLAVVAIVAYGGTPHGGPTTVCDPITVFGHHFTASADCRYISIAELVVAGVCLFLGLVFALSARPRPFEE